MNISVLLGLVLLYIGAAYLAIGIYDLCESQSKLNAIVVAIRAVTVFIFMLVAWKEYKAGA